MSGAALACRRIEFLIDSTDDQYPGLGLDEIGYDACGEVVGDWQPFMLRFRGRALVTLWVSRLGVSLQDGHLIVAHARETPIGVRGMCDVIAAAVQNRF